jgi:hypothetical protein
MTANQAEKEAKASEYFERIQKGEKFNKNEDGNFGVRLGTLLFQAGWRSFSTGSRCKVAAYEDHLEFEGSRVNIVVSNLFGNFTQVSVT